MLLVFTYNYRTRHTHTHELQQQPEFAILQRLLTRLHWKEWLLGWGRSLFSGVGQGACHRSGWRSFITLILSITIINLMNQLSLIRYKREKSVSGSAHPVNEVVLLFHLLISRNKIRI